MQPEGLRSRCRVSTDKMADHVELPVPDYDHLPLGSLTHRIRLLDADGLVALRSGKAEW